jgi:hypothetical protein
VWRIEPVPRASVIALSFSSLLTEYDYDFVRVYDSSRLIQQFSGSVNVVSIGTLVAQSGLMLVEFTADSSIQSSGFDANYSSLSINQSVSSSGPRPSVPSISMTNLSVPSPVNSASDGPCRGAVVLNDPSGQLNDGTGLYLPLMNCTWIIEPSGAQQIMLQFEQLSLESGYDYIDIIADGVNLRLTGTQLPDALTLNSPVVVQLLTDSSVESQGFEAMYAAIGVSPTNLPNVSDSAPTLQPSIGPTTCMNRDLFTLTDDFGTLTDGDSLYSPNMNCTWQILPLKAQRSDLSRSTDTIVLTINTIEIESGYDFLNVYDAPWADPSRLMRSLTGRVAPPELLSASGSMTVEFLSDRSIQYSGFSATYMCTSCSEFGTNSTMPPPGALIRRPTPSPTSTTGECVHHGVSLISTDELSGTISVETYPANANCAWLILSRHPPALHADGWESVVVQFTSLDVENQYDFVEVWSSTDSNDWRSAAALLGRFTGSALPAPLSVRSPAQIVIVINSDATVQSSGFELHWTRTLVDVIPPVPILNDQKCLGFQAIAETSGVVSDGAGNYEPNVNCTWLLAPSTGTRRQILLEFTQFELEQNYDFVTVYAGSRILESQVVARLSGSVLPSNVVVDMPSVVVSFTSDGSVQQAGFMATFRA